METQPAAFTSPCGLGSAATTAAFTSPCGLGSAATTSTSSADVPGPFSALGPESSREEFADALAAFLRPHRRRYELLLDALGEEEELFSVLASGCRACLASAHLIPGFGSAAEGRAERVPKEGIHGAALTAILDAYLLNLHLLVDYPAEDHCQLPWYSFLNIFAAQPSRASVLPVALLRVPRTARTVLAGRYPDIQRAIFELFNADLGTAGQFHRFYNNYLAFAAASFAILCGPHEGPSAPATPQEPADPQPDPALPAMEAFLTHLLRNEAEADEDEGEAEAEEGEAEAESGAGEAEGELDEGGAEAEGELDEGGAEAEGDVAAG